MILSSIFSCKVKWCNHFLCKIVFLHHIRNFGLPVPKSISKQSMISRSSIYSLTVFFPKSRILPSLQSQFCKGRNFPSLSLQKVIASQPTLSGLMQKHTTVNGHGPIQNESKMRDKNWLYFIYISA